MTEREQFLPEIGQRLANSRQRLSRIFRTLTGISQHRMRLWWRGARAETGIALATLRRALT